MASGGSELWPPGTRPGREGAPRAFQLDFGAYEGHRLEQLVRMARYVLIATDGL